MLYFAYGSNLDKAALGSRVGRWTREAPATLDGHRLVFGRGWKHHTSGYANIIPEAGSQVAGAVFGLTEEQMRALDRYEGVHNGVYRRQDISVRTGRISVEATAYVMASMLVEHRPSRKYLNALVRGLRDFGYGDDVVRAVTDASGY